MSEDADKTSLSIMYRMDGIEQSMKLYLNNLTTMHNTVDYIQQALVSGLDNEPGLLEKQRQHSRKISIIEKLQANCLEKQDQRTSKWQTILIPTVTSSIIALVVVGLTLWLG